MYQEISSFDKIIIKQHKNTIIVLDIDETILYYDKLDKKWWTDTIAKIYKINGDYDTAKLMAENIWMQNVKKLLPIPTDFIGLHKMLINCKKLNIPVILLTARIHDMKSITFEHLNQIKIAGYDVYFSGKTPKGLVLDRIIKTKHPKITNIIFVDDMEYNLDNVTECLSLIDHLDVKCFKFVVKK